MTDSEPDRIRAIAMLLGQENKYWTWLTALTIAELWRDRPMPDYLEKEVKAIMNNPEAQDRIHDARRLRMTDSAKSKLKLFVWEDVLTDYTSGIVFAFAASEEEAWNEIVKKDGGIVPIDKGRLDMAVARWKQKIGSPKLVEKPEAFITWGGG